MALPQPVRPYVSPIYYSILLGLLLLFKLNNSLRAGLLSVLCANAFVSYRFRLGSVVPDFEADTTQVCRLDTSYHPLKRL